VPTRPNGPNVPGGFLDAANGGKSFGRQGGGAPGGHGLDVVPGAVHLGGGRRKPLAEQVLPEVNGTTRNAQPPRLPRKLGSTPRRWSRRPKKPLVEHVPLGVSREAPGGVLDASRGLFAWPVGMAGLAMPDWALRGWAWRCGVYTTHRVKGLAEMRQPPAEDSLLGVVCVGGAADELKSLTLLERGLCALGALPCSAVLAMRCISMPCRTVRSEAGLCWRCLLSEAVGHPGQGELAESTVYRRGPPETRA
jgi:hypothetical protein